MPYGTVTGRHKGKIFIIGGTSPRALEIPARFWRSGIVIGINHFTRHITTPDYTLVWDSRTMLETPIDREYLFSLRHPVFLREDGIRGQALPLFHPVFFNSTNQLEGEWHQRLTQVKNTATTASQLAWIMGASKLLFAGVDFIDTTNIKANPEKSAPWPIDAINTFLARIPIPMFKTHPDSPLAMPYQNPREVLIA